VVRALPPPLQQLTFRHVRHFAVNAGRTATARPRGPARRSDTGEIPPATGISTTPFRWSRWRRWA